MDSRLAVHVDGTVVRVLDRGCRTEGRPWRALVQDKMVENVIHVTISRGSSLQEGDSISFEGRLVCPFQVAHASSLRMDLPRQVSIDDDDAASRLVALMSEETARVTPSNGVPDPAPEPGQGHEPAAGSIRRPSRGADPAVNWVVGRFSERGASECRGPVIVLDPALCASNRAGTAMPFMNNRSSDYIEQMTKNGRAGVRMLLDSASHPRRRWWGIVVPPSLMQDPLQEWRGFVGRWSGLLPKALPGFDTSLRLGLAHEMAHVVQHAYGVPMADGSSAAAECFADSGAIILFLADGGSAHEARLYAHQRAAGALMFPGEYSTGAACHAAISEARRMMGLPGRMTTHDALCCAARISRTHAPPPAEELEHAASALPRGGSWDKLRWTGFDGWMDTLEPHVAQTFRLAAEGVHACAHPPGHGMQAGHVLARAWDDISERLGRVGMQELRGDLQARLDEACRFMLRQGSDPDEARAGLALLGHRVSTAGRGPCRRAHVHVVAGGEPDPMEPLWSLSIQQRLETMREERRQASNGDEEAATRMGEAAMSLLLDLDTRSHLDSEDYHEAAEGWAASLPEGRHMLTSQPSMAF